ncbi:MAG: GNAT family N-acetyltransferase [Jatrophihabitans sp.]|uniref:GNAT family N-acetyltransferase n=1 Tax=Jatrophihabitans sp. TaxID=1932789 RepID=UPI003F7E3648
MHIRPAASDDVAALTDLDARIDTHWFGRPERSADEVREFLDLAEPLADNTRLLFDGDRLIAAGQRFGHDSVLAIDPGTDAGPVCDVLLPWFAERPGRVEALSRDAALVARLEAAGWQHAYSSFDLLCDVTPDLRLDTPQWPDGVTIDDLDRADLEAVHRLIYVDAAWAEIPGHPERSLDDWRSIFVTDQTDLAQQVVARRDGRIVGVALGRIWDDGTGWVSQLATAKSERRQGLGRALLTESLRRRVAAGATSLGLSVQASNEGALSLYLSVGLRIDREYRTYVAPR